MTDQILHERRIRKMVNEKLGSLTNNQTKQETKSTPSQVTNQSLRPQTTTATKETY